MTAVACGGGSGTDDSDIGAGQSATTATTAAPVPTTVGGTTLPATTLTLRLTDVKVVNSEEADSGMRILLPPGVASASVTVTGLPSPNRSISVCQAKELDRRMSGAACRNPADGEAVTVALGSTATGVEIAQTRVTATDPAGSLTSLSEVKITYAASSREVSVRLQQLAGNDSGNRPTFSMTPRGSGSYRAVLNWKIIPVFGGTDSRGQLELVQGDTVVNASEGASNQVQLDGAAPAGTTDVAVRIRNIGVAAMVTPELTATFP